MVDLENKPIWIERATPKQCNNVRKSQCVSDAIGIWGRSGKTTRSGIDCDLAYKYKNPIWKTLRSGTCARSGYKPDLEFSKQCDPHRSGFEVVLANTKESTSTDLVFESIWLYLCRTLENSFQSEAYTRPWCHAKQLTINSDFLRSGPEIEAHV